MPYNMYNTLGMHNIELTSFVYKINYNENGNFVSNLNVVRKIIK